MSLKRRVLSIIGITLFVLLLMLTFFSNTIRNMSLPVVVTSTIGKSKVERKVRCQGIVKIAQSEEIKLSRKRRIKEIYVENGDNVTKGEVIMTFYESDEELDAAIETLNELERDYEKSALVAENDYTENELSIESAKIDVENAKRELDVAYSDEEELEILERQLDDITMENYNHATPTDADKDEIEQIKNRIEELKQSTSVYDAEINLKKKQLTLDSLTNELSRMKKLSELDDKKRTIDNEALMDRIVKQKKLIENMQKERIEIKSPENGIINGIMVSKNDYVDKDEVVAFLLLDEEGYVVEAEINKEDAERIKEGEVAEVENRWGDEISVVVRSVRQSQEDKKKYRVVFDVSGDISEGDSLYLSVGDEGEEYPMVVPNGAVREDVQGCFVLTVNEKTSPLGTRYRAKKVYIDLIISDTERSAVSGDISEGDTVIVTAGRPIYDGQQVRIR